MSKPYGTEHKNPFPWFQKNRNRITLHKDHELYPIAYRIYATELELIKLDPILDKDDYYLTSMLLRSFYLTYMDEMIYKFGYCLAKPEIFAKPSTYQNNKEKLKIKEYDNTTNKYAAV